MNETNGVVPALAPAEQFYQPTAANDADSGATSASEPKIVPTAEDPHRGLIHLPKVVVCGREAILGAAAEPPVYIWEDITEASTINLLAGGVAGGKTTLLFLLIAARANTGAPVKVLGHMVTPASPGQRIIIIEAEHWFKSACRMLKKSLDLLGIGYEALDRVDLVARKSVKIGSPEWQDIEKMVAAGIVADIDLDTLARVGPSDANDEAEQVAIFERLSQTIEMAPEEASRPTVWIAAHLRKGRPGEVPSVEDVGGSVQRGGQSDVIIGMAAQRENHRVTSVKVGFLKVRERDAEDYPDPVEYRKSRAGGIELVDGPSSTSSPSGLASRTLDYLKQKGPSRKTPLRDALQRSSADIGAALEELLADGRVIQEGEAFRIAPFIEDI